MSFAEKVWDSISRITDIVRSVDGLSSDLADLAERVEKHIEKHERDHENLLEQNAVLRERMAVLETIITEARRNQTSGLTPQLPPPATKG